AKDKPLLHTEEYPLFTDAHILSEAVHGPYHFLNTVAVGSEGVRPGVILRFEWYWEFPHPDFSRTDSDRYHGGTPAEELAALASLAMGTRFGAGNSIREFASGGDPKGRPRAWTGRPIPALIFSNQSPILPNVARGEHSLDLLSPLDILPAISPSDAFSLLRCSRFYQDAIWIAESAPDLGWLLFVSALETAALSWRSQKDSPSARLRVSKPELFEYLSNLSPAAADRVANEFADSFGATKNFLDFVINFRPAEPQERPEWGAIKWSDNSLRGILKTVYDYRSKALHSGKPFPAPMCEPPYRASHWASATERPLGHVSMRGGTWLEKDVPILLNTFEYITRETLLNWWRSLKEPRQSGERT